MSSDLYSQNETQKKYCSKYHIKTFLIFVVSVSCVIGSKQGIFYTLVNCVHNLTYYFLSLFCSKKLTNSYTNKRLSNTIWTFLCFKKAIYTFANFLCKLFSKADCCTDCQGCYLSHIRTHHFALRIHIYINLMSAKYIAIIISYSIGTILIHKDVFHAFF